MKIITLTLAPALDVTYSVGGEIKFGLNRASGFEISAGGKGINVSRSVRREAERAGAEARLLTVFPSGGAVGDVILRTLSTEGIEVKHVKIAAETRVNVSAIPMLGEDIEINARGAFLTSGELAETERIIMDSACSGDVVAICGSCPAGVSVEYPSHLAAKLKKRGIYCALDCDGAALRSAVLSGSPPDLIKPNSAELSELCSALGIECSAESVVRFTGGKTAVLATFGRDGACLTRSENGAIVCENVKSSPVAPVRIKGAGDTLLGAFLFHKFSKSLSDSAALAAAVSAASSYVAGE